MFFRVLRSCIKPFIFTERFAGYTSPIQEIPTMNLLFLKFPIRLLASAVPALMILALTTTAQSVQQQPTAAEMSKKETVASALLRDMDSQEYEIRSAAEAMPDESYGYRPVPEGKFKNEKPDFGPADVRTFAEQVKHVACANFAFAAEFDAQKPPEGCDKGGPDPAKAKRELLIYLRNSFMAIHKSLDAITEKNQFDPIEGPYAGPNTRLGLAAVVIWHNADHYGQMTLYLRLNGLVPPASRQNPPPVKDTY
jgi:uncharacterized damage-inducible protein DinB